MRAGSTRSLPCPGVRFEEGFARRLEALVSRLSAARDRRESGGAPRVVGGGGSEFVGYRPYTAGDDPRAIDWDVLARSRRAFVKVRRRESGEAWRIELDASASMGVGPPGKLQRAAEVAAGIAALAVAAGAEARVVVRPSGREYDVARRPALAALLAFLAEQRAEGGPGDRATRSAHSEASRIFLVGDLRDAVPEETLALHARGRELAIVQILAPVEITPPASGSVAWWDPEGGAELSVELDADARGAYEAELAGEIELWRGLCARRGVLYACSSSELEFEEILDRSLSR
jgi:uncharacterized protein (DUF58 family)